MKLSVLCPTILLLIAPFSVHAQDYSIEKIDDGTFTFEVMGGKFNSGSSLERDSYIVNFQSAPVKINKHRTFIEYSDPDFVFSSNTNIETDKQIRAIQIISIQYDVFDDHLQNLSNTEVQDISGSEKLSAEWRARNSEVSSYLNSVTYIAKVRLSGGKTWEFDEDVLLTALNEIGLDKVGFEPEE